MKTFSKCEQFDVNCNTLDSTCSRGNGRMKCLRFLVEKFNADINIGDVVRADSTLLFIVLFMETCLASYFASRMGLIYELLVVCETA